MRRATPIFAAIMAVAVTTPAQAHITVAPGEGAAGTRQVYVVRMPNEKQVDTVRLDLRVPEGLRVTSVRQQPGWSMTLEHSPSGSIVAIHCAGALGPDQYAEFALQARNPDQPGELRWAARQSYSDGLVVDWTGERGSKTPAPVTTIVPAVPVPEHAGH